MESNPILERIDDPPALESLYRASPTAFHTALAAALAAHPQEIVLRVWSARLGAEPRQEPVAKKLVLALAIAACGGLLVRLPALWLTEAWYYPRFGPTIVLAGLALYFGSERRGRHRLAMGSVLVGSTALFVSVLPGYTDSVVMALLHVPIIWWVFLGMTFSDKSWTHAEAGLAYLRYNGELLIIGSLVTLGGIVFSGLTVALFELASIGAGEWYARNIGVMGIASVPVASTYLYDAVFRKHTGIASVLARIFAPLFLLMTSAYLGLALVGGESPFLDRDFLIIVNGLLLVVLGMTVLSIAERNGDDAVCWVDTVNLALLGVTLLIDVLALSAILFRVTSYGFTPNRVVVLGANLVILVHLASIGRAHVRLMRGATGITEIHAAAAGYLPIYGVWAGAVCLLVPLVFRFS